MPNNAAVDAFIKSEQLPQIYAEVAAKFFDPVADAIVTDALVAAKGASSRGPLFIALSGCQGSGKSTLSHYLSIYFQQNHLTCVVLSLDDFYKSKAERQALSISTHPLLKTRGVPGTHDAELMRNTLTSLKLGKLPCALPRFDKSIDDLVPRECWDSVTEPVDIVIFEGWCLGVKSVDQAELHPACNAFESAQDQDASWRMLVNDSIKSDLEPIYSLFDYWLFLKAPSFDSVFNWRLEQEQKLKERVGNTEGSEVMDSSEIHQFIQYYQRLTERVLQDLPSTSDVMWTLGEDRSIINMSANQRMRDLGVECVES